ncbi:hypothetical protein [Pediococcus pentosaceus]|uniref:hypothetical protein n=1 Tax=Pediococcus pentosaceus TaxID=1255 RepID=UPI002FE463B5
MLKEYRKTATIKAEQFDGSTKMLINYPIKTGLDDITGTDLEYYLLTKEGPLMLNLGDWIATGVEGENRAIADEIFKKTYEEVENEQGYMQYINSPDDMYAKGVYMDATPCKMEDTE